MSDNKGDKGSKGDKGISGLFSRIGDKIKNNPLGFIKIVLVVIVVASVLYFVIKYWKVIKYLGLATALAAAFPFLAEIIGGVVGVFGAALTAAGALFKTKSDKNKKDNPDDKAAEDKADQADAKLAEDVKEGANRVGTADPGEGKTLKLGMSDGETKVYTTEDISDKLTNDMQDPETAENVESVVEE